MLPDSGELRIERAFLLLGFYGLIENTCVSMYIVGLILYRNLPLSISLRMRQEYQGTGDWTRVCGLTQRHQSIAM